MSRPVLLSYSCLSYISIPHRIAQTMSFTSWIESPSPSASSPVGPKAPILAALLRALRGLCHWPVASALSRLKGAPPKVRSTGHCQLAKGPITIRERALVESLLGHHPHSLVVERSCLLLSGFLTSFAASYLSREIFLSIHPF